MRFLEFSGKAVYRAYYRMVFATLGTEARTTIDRWFITDPVTLMTPWNDLKHDPGSPSVQHLRDLADWLLWFDQQAIDRTVIAGIPDVKVAHFASEARTLDAARMKDMQAEKRYTLAVALYLKQAARTRDDLAEMLVKRMGSIHKQGKAALADYSPSAASRYQHIDGLFSGIVDWKLIATHLPDMLRVVLSIKAGTLTPSTILRTLNSENQHNLVYRRQMRRQNQRLQRECQSIMSYGPVCR